MICTKSFALKVVLVVLFVVTLSVRATHLYHKDAAPVVKENIVLTEGVTWISNPDYVPIKASLTVKQNKSVLALGLHDYRAVNRTEIVEVLPKHVQLTVEVDNNWYHVTLTEREFTNHKGMDNLMIKKWGSLRLEEVLGTRMFITEVYPYGRSALFIGVQR